MLLNILKYITLILSDGVWTVSIESGVQTYIISVIISERYWFEEFLKSETKFTQTLAKVGQNYEYFLVHPSLPRDQT